MARIILTDTTIYCDQPAVLTQPMVGAGGIAPAFLRVVDVHRTGEHKEILGVDDDTIPCGEFDLLGEGSRLRVAPVEVEDLKFDLAIHWQGDLLNRSWVPLSSHLSESTPSEPCHHSSRLTSLGLPWDRAAVNHHPALDGLVREAERIGVVR